MFSLRFRLVDVVTFNFEFLLFFSLSLAFPLSYFYSFSLDPFIYFLSSFLLFLDCSMTSFTKETSSKCSALALKIIAECSTTKARACQLTLPHASVLTPVFMPVGTQGTLKGLLPEQLKRLGCNIMLGNTYHLGNRPVKYIYITFH